jgi:hypothetical protein
MMFILKQVGHSKFSRSRVGEIKTIEVEFKLVSGKRIED